MFFKHTITFTVYSQADPLTGDESLASIEREAAYGELVMGDIRMDVVEVTPKAAADGLYAVGSEPRFFGLDDDAKEMGD
jgi:hypothetical protein